MTGEITFIASTQSRILAKHPPSCNSLVSIFAACKGSLRSRRMFISGTGGIEFSIKKRRLTNLLPLFQKKRQLAVGGRGKALKLFFSDISFLMMSSEKPERLVFA